MYTHIYAYMNTCIVPSSLTYYGLSMLYCNILYNTLCYSKIQYVLTYHTIIKCNNNL